MLKWIKEKYDDWKFEKEFQAKKKELMKSDPFIYYMPENEVQIEDSKNKKTS